MDNESKDFSMENGVYKGQTKLIYYKNLGELMWISIQSHRDKIAYLDAYTEETVTYAELQDKVVRCALWLQKQGIKSSDIISICTGNHLNSFVPCLSAVYVNAIFNPWNENFDLQNMLYFCYFLQMTMPKIIFCNEKSVNIVLSAIKKQNCNSTVVVFGKHVDAISFSDILRNCNDAEMANFRYFELDDIKKTACIMHSSGTTEMPKGVELSNYSMLFTSEDNNLNMTNLPVLWFSSLYWISAVVLSMKAIVQGAKIVIYPEFDEEITCQLIEKYKIAFIFFGTSMINRFARAGYIKKYSLSSLKTILFGGAIIKPKGQEKLKCTLPHVSILQAYGMTEFGGLITLQTPNHKNGSCGTVLKNIQIKIVDPANGKVVGPNRSGEIWIKSAIMTNGYYKNSEVTKSTIDKEGWLHSGDIGYIDEDGELFIIARMKELIKYRGYQISPGEIESVLITHSAVLEAAVVGVSHALDDEHPLAFITKKFGAKETEQELIDFVAKNMMDHYKLRGGVIFLDKFPYTNSGKIAKKDLREMTKKFKHTN